MQWKQTNTVNTSAVPFSTLRFCFLLFFFSFLLLTGMRLSSHRRSFWLNTEGKKSMTFLNPTSARTWKKLHVKQMYGLFQWMLTLSMLWKSDYKKFLDTSLIKVFCQKLWFFLTIWCLQFQDLRINLLDSSIYPNILTVKVMGVRL